MHLFLWCKNLWSKKDFTDEPRYHSCKVEIMDEESENYRPTEFLKTKQNFFKDFCFKFEGLSDECEKGFTHIIKDLGGKVSKNAKYTLVEKSYFEKDENKKRKDLYHLHFILDCLDYKKLLDIELYRCDKTFNGNVENSPSILQSRRINFNDDNINNTSERNNFSNDKNSNDDMPISKVTTPLKSKKRDETLKTIISNVKERNPCGNNATVIDNSSNESNSDDDIQMSEGITATKSQDRDEALKKTVSNVKKKPSDNNVSVSGIIDKATIRNNFSNESNSDDDDVPISEKITPTKSQDRDEIVKNTVSKKKKSCTDNISDSGVTDKVTVRNSCSNESNSDDDVSEMITPTKSQDRDEILKKTVSNTKNRKPCNNNISANSRIDNTTVRDNVSNEINSDNEIPTIERVKQSKSQQNDKILKKNNSNAKKRKLGNPIRSDTESSSSDESVKIKTEASSSDSSNEIIKVKPEPKSSDSSDDSYLTSNKKSKNKRVNVKSEISSSSDESTNYESESEPSKRKRRKKECDTRGQTNTQKRVSQNKTNSKNPKRTWVDTKDLEHNRNKDKKDDNTEEQSSSNSPIEWTKSKIEERPDLKWLFEVDKNDLCTLKKCTFAPGVHESHCYAGRIISDEEKKIILQYLIKNNEIKRAKGIRTWEQMISAGYLSHRSADTLRNCLRRVILPGICRFKLPIDILDQFLSLDEKKPKGKKIW